VRASVHGRPVRVRGHLRFERTRDGWRILAAEQTSGLEGG
jgi:hypothetical protein